MPLQQNPNDDDHLQHRWDLAGDAWAHTDLDVAYPNVDKYGNSWGNNARLKST
jgi:hypothetical protein